MERELQNKNQGKQRREGEEMIKKGVNISIQEHDIATKMHNTHPQTEL